MKVSNIGLISTKMVNIDKQFPAQDMLVRTGQLDQFGSGIYSYGHIPFLVKNNIKKVISDTLTKYGCTEISLPILQPESLWIESGRLEKYISEGVMLRCLTEKGNFCLAPTAEEAVVNYARTKLLSYKNLPNTFFQIGDKYRNELRARGFLLRGKSFEMMDAYSFGKDQKDLNNEYDRMKNAYYEIFNKLGLKTQAVGADNGSIGGSRSEEFMFVSDIGEDNVLLDKNTGIAFNSELLEKDNYEEYLKDTYGITDTTSLVSTKAVELGHIFQLGDKYAKSMNACYTDVDGNTKYYSMGCYGIGVSRTLAMLYENSRTVNNKGEFDGVSLPINIAPYIIDIVPKTDDEDKFNIANKIYEELLNKGIPVLFDDRSDVSIGGKIKDAKMMGTPLLAVFGKTLDDGVVEIENTKNQEKTVVSIDTFVNELTKVYNNRNN